MTTLRQSYSSFPPAGCEVDALNCDNLAKFEIVKLLNLFPVKHVIETGTFKGYTTEFFAGLFEEKEAVSIHTIESNKEYYDKAVDKFKNTNVSCHFGNSPELIKEILSSIKSEDNIFFYLDAHNWGERTPICNELSEIGNHAKNLAIIVIDDCLVPNFPDLGHDPFIEFKEFQWCFEHVYPDGYFHYYNRRSGHPLGRGTGKMFVIPLKYYNKLPKDSIVSYSEL